MNATSELIDPDQRLRLVHIEDDDFDATYFAVLLRRSSLGEVDLVRYRTATEALEALADSSADVIMTDLSLPDGEGLSTVRTACAAAGSAPVVVMTGRDDPDLALAALGEGAQDYLVKGTYTEDTLARSIRHALARARAEMELRDTTTALLRSNRDLDEYASIASHDLRAPIRTGRLLLDRLLATLPEPVPERSQDFGRRLDGCLTRLESMVRSLLEFAQVGDHRGRFETVDVDTVARDACRALTADLQSVGAHVDIEAAGLVAGDEALLGEVLSNLIENAIKYRSPDRPLAITIRTRLTDRRLHLEVEDNGQGIPDEYRSTVFKMFERLHTARDIDGLGFGLTMCNRIISLHDGDIWIESGTDDIGTRVCLSLPTLHG